MELQLGGVFLPHFFEGRERGGEVFLLDSDRGFDEIGLLGAAESLGSSGDRGIRLIEEAELELAGCQHLGVVGAGGLGVVAGLEEWQGHLVALPIHAGAGHVPIVLALGLGFGLAGIVGNLVDVAEGDELLEQGLVGIGAGFRACLAGSVRVFPCGQGFDRSPLGEGILEHAPFHILADGQSKVMQHSGCDIEQAGAEDQFVRLEARPAGGDDALRPMPHCDARRHARCEFRPQVVAVEAVVRDEHHSRIRPGELHEALEEEVVQAVGAIHDIAIHRKVLFGDTLHARRVVGHEEVADLIHRPIVNGHEVPLGIGLQKVRGGIVRGEGLGELLREHPQAFILRLIHLRGIGHKKPDHLVGVDLMRAQPQVIHRLRQLGRPVGAGRRRGPLGGILILLGAAEVAEHI